MSTPLEQEIDQAYKTTIAAGLAAAELAAVKAASIFAFWVDDAPAVDKEKANLPAVAIATAPWISATGTSHCVLREMQTEVTCLTHYDDDPKRAVLRALMAAVRTAIEDEDTLHGNMDGSALNGCKVVAAPPPDVTDHPIQRVSFTVNTWVRVAA